MCIKSPWSAVRGGASGPLTIGLYAPDGETLAIATVDLQPDAGAWDEEFPVRGTTIAASLESPRTLDDGVFAITADPQAEAELWLHGVSMMPANNLDGLHPAIVDAFRALPANVVKYPGGCFADSYDWRLGLGPRSDRHGAPNYAWGTWEENDFGTDEFLRWCELTATEPYLCVNHGTGSPELAAAWVEHENVPVTSLWGRSARRTVTGSPTG